MSSSERPKGSHDASGVEYEWSGDRPRSCVGNGLAVGALVLVLCSAGCNNGRNSVFSPLADPVVVDDAIGADAIGGNRLN